jgi:site-specific DNA recombinase
MAPFGYRLVNKKIVLEPTEAEQVKEVYTLYLNQKLSMRKIARKTGLSFSKVEMMLMNPIYSGKLAWGKTKYKNHKGQFQRIHQDDWIMADSDHEAIITFEQWEQVQRIKKTKKSIPDSRNDNQIFKNLCYCSKCGSKMYYFNGWGKYRYYRCHDINRFEGCKSTSIRTDELESKVVRKINEMLDNKALWKSVSESNVVYEDKELKQIEASIKKVDKQINKLIDALADKDIAHMIKPKLLQLESDKKELYQRKSEIEYAPIVGLTPMLIKDITCLWEKLTQSEKSEGLSILIKKITIHPQHMDIQWTDPNIPDIQCQLDVISRNGVVLQNRF